VKHILITLLIISSAKALTYEQIKAKDTMRKISLEYLPEFRTLMDNFLETESSYCINSDGDDGKSKGCLQLGWRASYDVANKYPKKYGHFKEVSKETILEWLEHDDKLNMTIGVLYFKILLKRHKTIDMAIMAYNGLRLKSGKLNKPYLNRVLNKRNKK